jgi:hypothetical protein
MKRTLFSVLLAALAASACTSLPEVKGPFARSSKGATQIDAGADDAQRPEVSPYPPQSPFGN